MGLALGGEDLTADLHCKRTEEGSEILYARTRVVCAARAAGVAVFDTPFTDVDDIEGLQKDTAFAKSLGFDGKLVISPRHIDTVNEIFSPTEEEDRLRQGGPRLHYRSEGPGEGCRFPLWKND